jgi:hypothetical protein
MFIIIMISLDDKISLRRHHLAARSPETYNKGISHHQLMITINHAVIMIIRNYYLIYYYQKCINVLFMTFFNHHHDQVVVFQQTVWSIQCTPWYFCRNSGTCCLEIFTTQNRVEFSYDDMSLDI